MALTDNVTYAIALSRELIGFYRQEADQSWVLEDQLSIAGLNEDALFAELDQVSKKWREKTKIVNCWLPEEQVRQRFDWEEIPLNALFGEFANALNASKTAIIVGRHEAAFSSGYHSIAVLRSDLNEVCGFLEAIGFEVNAISIPPNEERPNNPIAFPIASFCDFDAAQNLELPCMLKNASEVDVPLELHVDKRVSWGISRRNQEKKFRFPAISFPRFNFPKISLGSFFAKLGITAFLARIAARFPNISRFFPNISRDALGALIGFAALLLIVSLVSYFDARSLEAPDEMAHSPEIAAIAEAETEIQQGEAQTTLNSANGEGEISEEMGLATSEAIKAPQPEEKLETPPQALPVLPFKAAIRPEAHEDTVEALLAALPDIVEGVPKFDMELRPGDHAEYIALLSAPKIAKPPRRNSKVLERMSAAKKKAATTAAKEPPPNTPKITVQIVDVGPKPKEETPAKAPEKKPAKETAKASVEDIDAKNDDAANPTRRTTSGSVANVATLRSGFPNGDVILIGIFGKAGSPRALVQNKRGKFFDVRVGDNVDGWRVEAISRSNVILRKGAQQVNLTVPRG